MKSIAVFSGSNYGFSPVYAQSARLLGSCLAVNKIELIYGGSCKGLMGLVADAALEAGGKVVGIMNQEFVDLGHLHPGLSEARVVPDMITRKMQMCHRADGFIALAGGLGTYEEIFEVATLIQVGALNKPLGLLNTNGFFNILSQLLQHAEDQGFLKGEHRAVMRIKDDPDVLLNALMQPQDPYVSKWL
ncbi:TIGR00730 family Rossman fold protein [Pseudomonas monteilii]|uniref:LOG family protein n=1 Tax=Pseudomonas monteilii TaxID=76759 RepID=UPI003CFF7D88